MNPWIGRNPESWRRSRGSNMMSGQFCPHCLSEIRGLLLEEQCFPKTIVNLEGTVRYAKKSSHSCCNKVLLELARPLTQNHVDCSLFIVCTYTLLPHLLLSIDLHSTYFYFNYHLYSSRCLSPSPARECFFKNIS